MITDNHYLNELFVELKKYQRTQLLKSVQGYCLFQSKKNFINSLKPISPWFLCFLFRLIINEWDNLKGTKPISVEGINTIFNHLNSYQNSIKSDYDETDKATQIVQKIAFHQLGRQDYLIGDDLNKSFNIFNSCPYLVDAYNKEFKFSQIEHQIYLAFLYDYLINKNYNNIYIHKHSEFSFVDKKIKNETLINILDYYSLEINSFKEFNNSNKTKVFNYDTEINSTSLYRKFLLKKNNRYYLLDKFILQNAIKNGIFYQITHLASIDKEHTKQVGHYKGESLERFTANVLTENNISYIAESELKRNGTLSKQVDFILHNNDESRILMEVKNIEPNNVSRWSFNYDLIFDHYQDTFIKAIEQLNYINSNLDPHKDSYCIILTYNDLYLGDAQQLWNTRLKDYFEKKNINITLDFSKVFLIDIQTFETLIKIHNNSFPELFKKLSNIRDKNLDNPLNKRFMFSQYLKE